MGKDELAARVGVSPFCVTLFMMTLQATTLQAMLTIYHKSSQNLKDC